MNLVNNSQREWLEKGGSEDALKFIEDVVGQLHTKAVSEGIIYKQVTEEIGAETTEVVETEEVVENKIEEVVITEADTETKSVEVVETPVVDNSQQMLLNVIVETVFAAQKQYHADVVEPLLAEIKSLKAATVKNVQSGSIFGWDMSALLPAAAVASKIKKEFGNGDELTGVEVKQEPVVVKEVAVNVNSGNLLSGF